MSLKLVSLKAIEFQINHVMRQIKSFSDTDIILALNFIQKSINNLKHYFAKKKKHPQRKSMTKDVDMLTRYAIKSHSPNNKSKMVIRRRLFNKCKPSLPQPSAFSLKSQYSDANECLNYNSKKIDENDYLQDDIYTDEIRDIEISVNGHNESNNVFLDNELETKTIDSLEPKNLQDDINSIENLSKNVICYICGSLLPHYISLTKHLFNHVGSQVYCLKCKKNFNNMAIYKLHENTECWKYSECTSELFWEYLVSCVIKNIGNKLKYSFYCPYCAYRFTVRSNLIRHMKNVCIQNPNHFECLECKISFKDREKYETHKKNHDKHECCQCQATFPTKIKLKQHANKSHTQVKKNIQCKKCDMSFPTRLTWRNHLKTHKEEDNDNILSEDKTNRVWCNICLISFYDEYTYNRHCLRKSHLEKVNSNLEVLNEKKFICACGQTFFTKDGLTTHSRNLHMEKDMLTCDKCSYKTTKGSNMKRHMNNVHITGPYQNKKYVCDKCPLMFFTSSAVKEHITSVHCKERTFSCEICLKSFKLKSQLTRHKNIHSPLLPYLCNHCSVAFKRHEHLKRHIEAKHKDHLVKTIGCKDNILQKPSSIDTKFMQMSTPVISAETAQQTDRVFSLIDVHSGELVTLSATELSKNAIINMSDGGLLNVHIPEIWNQPDPMYSLNQTLHDTIVPQPEYILSHDNVQMTDVLQNEQVKESEYCIVKLNENI